jgi:aminoglycoside phosphotransferase (APT) family kinase protein
MTAVPGTPMSTSYYGWRHTARITRVAADLAAVDKWLADFQRETAQAEAPMCLDEGVTERLQNRFADDPELDADLECLAEIYARLERDSITRTAVHGDLWFGNVLASAGRICGVVDWEAGAASGEPTRDLVRFANSYAFYLDRSTAPGRRVAGHRGLRAGGGGAGLEFALNGTGWFPELFQGFLQDGLARLGASTDSWRDASLAGIAELAAFTDEHDYARLHLELFRRLATRSRKDRP